jgi:hypothetical protein
VLLERLLTGEPCGDRTRLITTFPKMVIVGIVELLDILQLRRGPRVGRKVNGIDLVPVVLVLLFVSGCTSAAHKLAASRGAQASSYLQRGLYLDAYQAIEYDLRSSDPVIRQSAQAVIDGVPGFWDHLFANIALSITRLSSPPDANTLYDRISRLYDVPSIERQRITQLDSSLQQQVVSANLTGQIPFTIISDISRFPALNTASAKSMMFERSVIILASSPASSGYDRYLLRKTMEYVNQEGRNTGAYATLERHLDQIPISTSDLQDIVAPLYPSFVERTLRTLALKSFLTTDPKKRLLEEDVASKLKSKSQLIQFVREPAQDALEITISELQYEERVDPERTQTALVDNLQVAPLVSVLTMPRGASFLYDVTQGGAEVHFAYDIRAKQDGKVIFEKLLRDKLGDTYYDCSNARVQNVYGGLSGATFWPNAQVQTFCQQGRDRVDVTQLREKIPERLAAEISSIPVIANTAARVK